MIFISYCVRNQKEEKREGIFEREKRTGKFKRILEKYERKREMQYI